jgi:hypothetical protein
MWTALAVAALGLAPEQAGQLTLDNVRYTRGVLGPARGNSKVLPGESLYLCFDVEGVTADESGKARYSIGLEVSNADGKVIFKQDPREQQVTLSLGAGRIPAFANINIGFEQPSGEYTLKVAIADLAGGGKGSVSKTFEVLSKDFGLVQLATTADAEGLLPVPTPGAGQGLWLHVGVTGFTRDASSKQPNVTVSLRVLDEAGKPTVARASTGSINKGVPDNTLVLPVQMPLLLNRPGKYTVELTATDSVGGKKDTLSFPLTVAEVK